MKSLSEIAAKSRSSKASFIAFSGVIAALYVALSFVSWTFGLASNEIQFRVSEVMYVLALFTPAAIPGLTIGCLIFNWISGGVVLDVFVGSFATLIGVVGTYLIGIAMRKRRATIDAANAAGANPQKKFHFGAWLALALMPNIISNTLIIPLVLRYGYGITDAYVISAVFIFAGEFLSCGVLGYVLGMVMKKRGLL